MKKRKLTRFDADKDLAVEAKAFCWRLAMVDAYICLPELQLGFYVAVGGRPRYAE